MGVAFGAELGVQLANPDPSKDAHEARQKQVEQKKENTNKPQNENWLYQFMSWLLK
jgi:hypothetical protein